MVHPTEQNAGISTGGRRLLLPRVAFDQIVEHACRAYPRECCGVLIGRTEAGADVCHRVVPGINITAGDPARRYQLDWRTLLDCVKDTRKGDAVILGFYHSHPGGAARPSERDRDEAWEDVTYLIVAVSADQDKPEVTACGGWRVVEAGGPFVAERLTLV